MAIKDWRTRKRLTVVTVRNPETGEGVSIWPNEPLPDWCPEIDNMSVFESEEDAAASGYPHMDYESMTVPQLVELAKERNIELTSTKKAEVIAALEGDEGAFEEPGPEDLPKGDEPAT